jgi:hypothetical protein
MTPDQFNSALKALSLTTGDAAAFLRLEGRRIRRMRTGQEIIGPILSLLLTIMVERGISVAEGRKILEGQDYWEGKRVEDEENEMEKSMQTKHDITATIAQHFREGNLQWMTARQLATRYGGTQDHVKKVADKMVADGIAVKRRGDRGVTEYHGTEGAKS